MQQSWLASRCHISCCDSEGRCEPCRLCHSLNRVSSGARAKTRLINERKKKKQEYRCCPITSAPLYFPMIKQARHTRWHQLSTKGRRFSGRVDLPGHCFYKASYPGHCPTSGSSAQRRVWTITDEHNSCSETLIVTCSLTMLHHERHGCL